jgi:hypothetical protein
MAGGSTLGEWYNFAALALPDLAPQPASMERFRTETSAFSETTGQQRLPIIFSLRACALFFATNRGARCGVDLSLSFFYQWRHRFRLGRSNALFRKTRNAAR